MKCKYTHFTLDKCDFADARDLDGWQRELRTYRPTTSWQALPRARGIARVLPHRV